MATTPPPLLWDTSHADTRSNALGPVPTTPTPWFRATNDDCAVTVPLCTTMPHPLGTADDTAEDTDDDDDDTPPVGLLVGLPVVGLPQSRISHW
jgi:hypothetical protein